MLEEARRVPNGVVTFDTQRVVDRLREGGWDEGQARALCDVLREIMRGVAMSSELERVEASLRGEIKRVEASFQGEIKRVEASFQSEIKRVESSLRGEIKSVEASLEGRMVALEGQMVSLRLVMLAMTNRNEAICPSNATIRPSNEASTLLISPRNEASTLLISPRNEASTRSISEDMATPCIILWHNFSQHIAKRTHLSFAPPPVPAPFSQSVDNPLRIESHHSVRYSSRFF